MPRRVGRGSHGLLALVLAAAFLAVMALVSEGNSWLSFVAPKAGSAGPQQDGARWGHAFKPVETASSAPKVYWGAAAMAASAMLVVASRQKAVLRATATEVQRPEDSLTRDERPKGKQKVPLGRFLRPFFSSKPFWDFDIYPRTYFNRTWQKKDIAYALFFLVIHAGALAAPFYFTWKAFAVFLVGYAITGFGITLSYHRQLAHRSFTTPKWLEYFFAYWGVLALQSHPINWISSHRHHHGGCETEKDVHSPLDGFFWSHMGWLMDTKNTWMRANKSNASDLQSQWYYRFLQTTYPLHAIVLPIALLYHFGGLPFVFWGFFARAVWVWHVTWAVNSVSHTWGFQDWNTGDVSMNNWLIGILALGEGWHNNHHAFENSCRHGLKWWQVDPTWYFIKALEAVGLATNLKYPTESKMRRLSWDQSSAAAATA